MPGYIQARRVFLRNVLWLFLVIIFLVVGFLGGVAYVSNSKHDLGFTVRASNFDSVSVSDEKRWMVAQGSTTTTTTQPVRSEKKLVVRSEKVSEVKPEAPVGGWVSQCNIWMDQAGIALEDQVFALYLIGKESGCNPYADNPSSSAYGIPQALPGHKMASAGEDWATNPVTQLRWMQSYVQSRYGSWANAVAHSKAKGWY